MLESETVYSCVIITVRRSILFVLDSGPRSVVRLPGLDCNASVIPPARCQDCQDCQVDRRVEGWRCIN